jgi:molecular chaperone DnaK
VTEQIISKGVGIDLGTTNSAVAVMDPTDTDVLIHREQKSLTTPSCVWKSPTTGEIVVGRKAFARIGTLPEPIRSIKRLMGHPRTVLLTDEEVTPEQVSAAILAEMKRQIEQDMSTWDTLSTSWVVDRAIVTVPAYFDQPNIEATRKAAELAGLDVLDLLHEPTAAACYHCWRTGTNDGTFLVYDLGGGTFDVSVVRCLAGTFEVLGISGNNRLGGDDIDIAIARHIQEQLVRDGYALELDLEHDPEDRIRFSQLKFLAEGVKKALSAQTEFMLSSSGTLRDGNGEPVVMSTMWDRSELEAIARPIIERTIPYCRDAVELATARAGITLADVDQVILAGGSTHIPLVRDIVTSELCITPAATGPRARCTEPVYEKVDTVVALGAAIRAAAVGGLAAYDRDRTVRVSFRGTGSSAATTTRVGGRVEPLDPGIDLTDGHVRLVTADYEDEADLRPGGAFGFTGVPLQPGAETLLTFEVFDAGGNLITTTGRPVTHDPDRGPTGLETQTAQLSKAFLLEVDRGGSPYLKTLLEPLIPLPASADFTFSHPGDTELVLFPLYQKRRKIQVIEVPVPSTTPRGTPVRFNVEVDAENTITVKGTVGDVPFSALVIQPPAPKMPDPTQIDALERRFGEALQYLPAGERAVADAKWGKARASLDSAVALADEPHAVHEFEELEEIVTETEKHDPVLKPPKAEFDQMVKDCREINDYVRRVAAKAGKPHDHDGIARSIDVQAQLGERAFRDADQRSYAEAIEMLESFRAHLSKLYVDLVEEPDTRTPAERAANGVERVTRAAVQVARLAEAQGRRDVLAEVTSIQHELAGLEQEVHRNPQGVLNKLGERHARLEQLNNMMMGELQRGKKGRTVLDSSPTGMP